MKRILENGSYNVVDNNGNKILKQDYDGIDIQQHGIVARKDENLLDAVYDIYDLKGNFLFAKKYRVYNFNFYIGKNYVKIYAYEVDNNRWGYNSNSNNYYHLDGTKFNLDDCDAKIEMENGDKIVFSSSKGDYWGREINRYYYDVKNKKVVYDFNKMTEKVNQMHEEIKNKINSKIKIVCVKYIKQQAKMILERSNLSAKEKFNISKELNSVLKRYLQDNQSNRITYVEGYDYKSKQNYYDYQGLRDNEIDKVMGEINRNINFVDKKCINCSLYKFYDNNDKLVYGVEIQKTLPANDFQSLKSQYEYKYNGDYVFGKVGKLNIFKLNEETFEIEISKKNIAIFNNYYKKITGKQGTLSAIDIKEKNNQHDFS